MAFISTEIDDLLLTESDLFLVTEDHIDSVEVDASHPIDAVVLLTIDSEHLLDVYISLATLLPKIVFRVSRTRRLYVVEAPEHRILYIFQEVPQVTISGFDSSPNLLTPNEAEPNGVGSSTQVTISGFDSSPNLLTPNEAEPNGVGSSGGDLTEKFGVFLVSRTDRYFIAGESTDMFLASPKDPHAVIDYGIDWGKEISPDTIASSTWTVSGGIVADTTSLTGHITKVRLSGGTVGTPAYATNRIVLASGQVMYATIQFTIEVQ